MTREDENNSLEYQAVKEAWKRYNTQSIDKDFDVISFEEGAEFGYNFAIDKACEWLEKKAILYVRNNCEQGEHSIHKTMLDDFRKAMKGGEE